MIRCIFLFAATFLLAGKIHGQTYGNEWINYGQQYFRFPVTETGIHKLDYQALLTSGVPLALFNSNQIQVFGREQEVALWIEDGGDNHIDHGDYILFYAERNDGWIDRSLYQDETFMGNPYENLYSDTIYYFFSWSTGGGNKRVQAENNTDFSSYTASPFILRSEILSAASSYHEGVHLTDVSSSLYQPGEGFGYFSVSNGTDYSFNTSGLYTGIAPAPRFQAMIVGANNYDNNGNPNHHARWRIPSAGQLVDEKVYLGYDYLRTETTIPVSALSTGSTTFRFECVYDQGVPSDYDIQAVNYLRLDFPAVTDGLGHTNDHFWLPDNTLQGQVKLEFPGLNGNGHIIFVMSGGQVKKVSLTDVSGVPTLLVSNSLQADSQLVYIQEPGSLIQPGALQKVTASGYFADYGQANPEGALIMIHPAAFSLETSAYAMYRQSAAGGAYNVVRAEIDQLCMQYGGGVPKHAIGMRRFVTRLWESATNKPVGLFLVGKGINPVDVRLHPAASMDQNLVPTFGYPMSDNAITAEYQGNGWVPLLPTGRLSVLDGTEVSDYLDKIQLFDAEQDPLSVYNSATKDWQKQLLHFAGGSDIGQQQLFQGYLEGYENVVEGTKFGGHVNRYYKSSSIPFDPFILDNITQRISEGVSVMNFFGHALPGGSGFEINIDEPANWNNYGRYPVVIGNSCFNGNIFSTVESTSEKFVNVKDYGAIAFVSTVNYGFTFSLNNYTYELYRQFSDVSYGETLGEQMLNTIRKLHAAQPGDLYNESTSEQMTLNGDPMLHINWHQKPEIEITAQSLSFLPQDLDLTVDSIDVVLAVKNLGRSLDTTYAIEITRDFPNSAVDSIYQLSASHLNYVDTIVLKVPLQPNISMGPNVFYVKIDQPSIVPEQYDEVDNNMTQRSLLVNIDGILPVIPARFAVVPRDSITVRASTVDPVAEYNSYRFEIDTTDYFNSPEHRYAIVNGAGGVKEVNPSEWLSVNSGFPAPLVLTDSTVYFWRVAVNDGTDQYINRSFQYIPDKEGWGQDHFFQFRDNGFSNITYNEANRTRDFNPETKDLKSVVYGGQDYFAIVASEYYVNGNMQEYGMCFTEPSIHVAVIDPVTLEPWGTHYGSANPDHSFGNVNDMGGCRGRVERYFIFRNTGAQLAAFSDMVLNQIPDGHYILIYSANDPQYASWDASYPFMYSTFQSLGSTGFTSGMSNRGFSFFCKKGDPASVRERFLTLPQPNSSNGLSESADSIVLQAYMQGSAYLGRETSPLIGPSSSWKTVYWKQDPREMPTGDTTVLTINVFDLSQAYQFSIDTTFTQFDSIMDLSNLVNADQYPFIQLSAHYKDSITFTPAQVDFWHVLYTPLPEAAIDGTAGYTWQPGLDTLKEGQEVSFAVDVRNIFDYPMDSLLVKYWVEDSDHVPHYLSYPRQDSLRVNDVLRDTVTFSTLGLPGINSFWMEVNPYINGTYYQTDQPEQEHLNNLLQIPFYVTPDDINPILDVTFDGRHILNGDIIAPESQVLISLKDDNEFLVMDNVSDTSLFGVYLTDPSGTQKRVYFTDATGGTNMEWIPANQQNKRFKIIWPATFTSDGKYTLLVQGTDRSGNLSGDLEYQVTFEVVRESSITYLMNYPNPFSTSTRFVFTLTGNEVPEDMIIQIMTVTGKVVREITEDELGPIHVGRNVTEYAWDGTDEFGDRLANGVYLYTVKARIGGQDIEHRDSGADQYFKKEFGKMYLMR